MDEFDRVFVATKCLTYRTSTCLWKGKFFQDDKNKEASDVCVKLYKKGYKIERRIPLILKTQTTGESKRNFWLKCVEICPLYKKTITAKILQIKPSTYMLIFLLENYLPTTASVPSQQIKKAIVKLSFNCSRRAIYVGSQFWFVVVCDDGNVLPSCWPTVEK